MRKITSCSSPRSASDKVSSLGRLHSLTKNLIRSNKFGEYNKIIQEQINEGINEKTRKTKTPEKRKEIYRPHRPEIREFAEKTKIRIVYDVSAKPNKDSVSLNEYLETVPPLQNSPWSILIRLALFISSLFYFGKNYTIVIEIIILFSMSIWYKIKISHNISQIYLHQRPIRAITTSCCVEISASAPKEKEE